MERSESIQPARIEQVQKMRDGALIQIEADVGNVAADLKAIDPDLHLRYSVPGEFFVVFCRRELPDGAFKEDVVLTAKECDQRIVERIRQIDSPQYDYVGELEELEERAKREREARYEQMIGEAGERLHHAARKDLGVKTRAYVPRRIG